MSRLRRSVSLLVWLSLAGASLAPVAAQRPIPTPESVLGFAVGADFKLATYEESIRYFQALAAAVPEGFDSAIGTVHEVVYLGSDTRYHVSLEAGGALIVTKQNVATSSMEALALKGRPVRLRWHREHTLAVHPD